MSIEVLTALQVALGSSVLTTVGVFALARFTSAFDAYSGHRAQLLARFNSLDQLITETRELTQATEVIKAKIGDQVWDRQMRWSFKRDVYVDTLQAIGKIRNALARLDNAFTAEQQRQDWAIDEANVAREHADAASLDLLRQFDIAPIVVSPRAYAAIRAVVAVFNAGLGASAEHTQSMIANLNEALDVLKEEAMADLGYVE